MKKITLDFGFRGSHRIDGKQPQAGPHWHRLYIQRDAWHLLGLRMSPGARQNKMNVHKHTKGFRPGADWWDNVFEYRTNLPDAAWLLVVSTYAKGNAIRQFMK